MRPEDSVLITFYRPDLVWGINTKETIETAVRTVWNLCVFTEEDGVFSIYPDPMDALDDADGDDDFSYKVVISYDPEKKNVHVRTRTLVSQTIRRALVAIESAL
jgi:hypothetical protein